MKKVYLFGAEWCHSCKSLMKSLKENDIEVEKYFNADSQLDVDVLRSIGSFRSLPVVVLADGFNNDSGVFSGDIQILTGSEASLSHIKSVL